MNHINLYPIMMFRDGSYLVISTQYSKDGYCSCILYSAILQHNDRTEFPIISNNMSASTAHGGTRECLPLRRSALPRFSYNHKKPPCLIWHGPLTALSQ
jgi:hypothetical protein